MESSGDVCREVVYSEFLKRRARNSSYSLRSFARSLGLSPSAVSELFNRKRTLSLRNRRKICEKLALDPSRSEGILTGAQTDDSDHQFRLLREDEFALIADWYHFAILSLSEIGGVPFDPKIIADRLGISAFESRGALERLSRLGLIVHSKRGVLTRTDRPVRTSTDVASGALKRHHEQNLSLAEKALRETPVESRDITSITMAIDPKRLPEAKELIKAFRRKMSNFLESGNRSSIYVLAVQLFPVQAQDWAHDNER